MATLLIRISVVLMYSYMGYADACSILYTKQPTYGYRCVAGTEMSLYHADFPQCIWQCLRKRFCRYINHNSVTGTCELGFVKCEYLKPDVGFMVNIFELPRNDCLHWGSRKEPGRVPVQAYQGSQMLYVARIVSENNLLIGKYRSVNRYFWANREGARVHVHETNQHIEILTKHEACSVLWMDYIAGKTLPVGAVTGGHLADGSVTCLVKITHGGQYVFGYYNSKSELAYYEMAGVRTATSMQILVLV